MTVHLRYGLNPEQAATATLDSPASPVRVVAGRPSFVNLLDALSAWCLVREAASVTSVPAATSFKHVSPAGAAIAGPLDRVMTDRWLPEGVAPSPITTAYVRARDCDPRSSFGDFVAVSEPVDRSLAEVLRGVVSDGVIAPAFEPGTVDLLAAKKRSRYLVLEVDASFEPPAVESRELFGIRLEQQTGVEPITEHAVRRGTAAELPDAAVRDLMLAMVAARHTQSNTVTYALDGMVIGIAAGQQSRVDCTRIAGAKVDRWWLRRHAKVRHLPFRAEITRQDRINWELRCIEGDFAEGELRRLHDALTHAPSLLRPEEKAAWLEQLSGVAVASDGMIPFRDNVDEAARHGVRFIADPGGSARNAEVESACDFHGIAHTVTGVRLFRH